MTVAATQHGARLGGAGWRARCLKLADAAYGGANRVGRAIDQWYRASKAGFSHPKDKNPPIGAHLFWWTNDDFRNIATYAGGGKVVTNMSSEGGISTLVAAQELNPGDCTEVGPSHTTRALTDRIRRTRVQKRAKPAILGFSGICWA